MNGSRPAGLVAQFICPSSAPAKPDPEDARCQRHDLSPSLQAGWWRNSGFRVRFQQSPVRRPTSASEATSVPGSLLAPGSLAAPPVRASGGVAAAEARRQVAHAVTNSRRQPPGRLGRGDFWLSLQAFMGPPVWLGLIDREQLFNETKSRSLRATGSGGEPR